jgi:hypothetical protein
MSTLTTPEPDRQLDAFETRLLSELRREVSDQTRTAPAPRHGRPRLALLAGAAAAAVAGVVLAPGLGNAPAFSVSEGNPGEVHVEINRPEDAAGLERALADHGINADVTYLTTLLECAPGRYQPVDRKVGIALSMSEERVTVTLSPGAVRQDETFVMVWSVEPLSEEELAASDTGDGVRTVSGFASKVTADVTAGRVLPCRALPAPAD